MKKIILGISLFFSIAAFGGSGLQFQCSTDMDCGASEYCSGGLCYSSGGLGSNSSCQAAGSYCQQDSQNCCGYCALVGNGTSNGVPFGVCE